MSEKTTHVFNVNGMHCKACTVLIEDAISELPHVEGAKVSLAEERVTVTGTFEGSPQEIAAELSELIREHGYALSVEKQAHDAGWEDFAYALPIAGVLIIGFLLLQRVGLANLITSSNVSYGTAFSIGLIASVSSCLAIVGGLVLSLSASSAREGGTWRTPILFHAGRIGGFLLLGGLVGALGSSLHLGLTANIVLSALVALVMFILGVNLLDVFQVTKKLQLTMPARFSNPLMRKGARDHYLAPALIGIGTFFLPCGFTQSMQLYALSTGSFVAGAMTMFFFALGTFPVLALLSFSSLNIANKPWKGIFFKTAGLIVIALAVVNFASALATAGIINPLFNF
ncbi:MAG: sulfite exporter TauE/SafE family protein [Candidatus Paceibacteria bacterium]